MVYKNIIIKKKTHDLFKHIEEEYRLHHPEMEHIRLSKDKLIYEMQKIYLKTNYNNWKHLFDNRGEIR